MERADDYTPEEVRRATENFFGKSLRSSIPKLSDPLGQFDDRSAMVTESSSGKKDDPFSAADIHDCNRRLDELRGDR